MTKEADSHEQTEAKSDDTGEAKLNKFDNSDDLCNLISQVDPGAADDKFYTSSSEFNELRTRLGKELRKNLWVALGLGLVISSWAIVAL